MSFETERSPFLPPSGLNPLSSQDQGLAGGLANPSRPDEPSATEGIPGRPKKIQRTETTDRLTAYPRYKAQK